MLKNYLTIAIRNIARYKVYSFINIAGLAIGMACCALIMLYVQHELSYDNFHAKGDRIYRVIRETQNDNGDITFSPGISGPFAAALKKDFPEVEEAVRRGGNFDTWARYGDQRYPHSGSALWASDPAFFKVFDFSFLKGNRETALDKPFSVVMTKKTAQQYFGNDDPIGKVVTFESQTYPGDYTVTGVIEIPENSSIKFDMIFSLKTPSPESWTQGQKEEWQPTNTVRPLQALIVLREGEDPKALESKLPAFMEQYMGREIRQKNTYHLQPFNRIHLYTNVDFESGLGWPSGSFLYTDIQTFYLFAAIAGLIMLIACVNFMNLATARSTGRAKEVGLRKASGAVRFQLIQQFLGEAILLSLIAFVLALGLVELTLPTFSAFVEKSLEPERSIHHLLIVPGFVALVGLLAGSYPAFFLSAFEPVAVLKGYLKTGSKGVLFRKGLVVFQFAMSILLIIGTIMIQQQLNYMQNKKLGFDKEHLIRMEIFGQDRVKKTDENTFLNRRYQTVKQAFLTHPNILSATAYRVEMGAGGISRTIKMENGDTYQMLFQEADENFLNTFGIELISGRNISEMQFRHRNTQWEYLINEAAVKQFGWTDPLSKRIQLREDIGGTVVGVFKDFHNQPLHSELKPLIIFNKSILANYLTVKIQNKNIPETIAHLEKTWNQFLPDRPFAFSFVDENLNQLYREDQKVGQLVGTFASLAILVACLGLFGLAAYTAEQRTKEIGVRKVLGASVRGIVILLSTEFAKLVLIANLIAWPVAYFAIGDWLQNFAYRVELSWWVFALGGILALLIALLTVGYQAIRAALANPIEALRYE